MKTIYFAHSSALDYKKEYYYPILESDLQNKYQLIFPHEKSEEPFSSKELFLSDQCDLVVAEVSYPSTGSGIELGWADTYEIPIILLAREDSVFSGLLNEFGVAFIKYKDRSDMVLRLGKELSNLFDKK